MSYSDLLRDPRWQRKRLEVLERAGFTCEECGDTSTELHVHHPYYAKGAKPWEYDATDLLCLCKKCHAAIELRLDTLRALAGGLSPALLERLIGTARVMAAMVGRMTAGEISVESRTIALGVAAAFEELVADDVLALASGGKVKLHDLWSLAQEREVSVFFSTPVVKCADSPVDG